MACRFHLGELCDELLVSPKVIESAFYPPTDSAISLRNTRASSLFSGKVVPLPNDGVSVCTLRDDQGWWNGRSVRGIAVAGRSVGGDPNTKKRQGQGMAPTSTRTQPSAYLPLGAIPSPPPRSPRCVLCVSSARGTSQCHSAMLLMTKLALASVSCCLVAVTCRQRLHCRRVVYLETAQAWCF